MKDLFTLNDNGESGSTETSNIFSQVSENVNVVGSQKDNQTNHIHPEVVVHHADGVAAENGNRSEIALSRRKGKEKADQSSGDADTNKKKSSGDVDEETHMLRSLFDANGIHVSFIRSSCLQLSVFTASIVIVFSCTFFDIIIMQIRHLILISS